MSAPRRVRGLRRDDLGELRRIASSALDRDLGDGAALVDLFARRAPDDHVVRVVATGPAGISGFAFASLFGDRGFVDMFAVDERLRRRGVGSALLAHIEEVLARAGARSVSVGGNGHIYAWPGVDVDYAAAIALTRGRGYRRSGVARNMEVELSAWRSGTARAVLCRHGAGARVRRATSADWPALSRFVAREFTDGWRNEAAMAMQRRVPHVFIATRDEAVVGFACHGVYRSGWFGPIGTAAAERGRGIGEALLRMCLDDLARAGVGRAQIAWVGPTGFYSRTVNAHAGREFAILTKDVV
jgi:ribosomal protein S18 acetylase RimI-like enzyme